jgi:4-amino-4-deoxy-L-arabinose transferase-like glycosyltransferase
VPLAGNRVTATDAPGQVKATRFRLALARLTAAAFVGRLLYVWRVTSREDLLPLPGRSGAGTLRLGRTVDEYYYRSLAISIAHGKGFVIQVLTEPPARDAVHPPLTSIIVAPVARFFPDNDIALRLPVALAGALVVALAGLVAAEVAGPRAGLSSAGIAAVYPNLWMHDGLLLSETFSALMTIAAVYFTFRLIRHPRYSHAIALGLACALAALTRAELLLLLPLLVVPAALWRLPPERRWQVTTAATLATAVGVAPVVVYNMTRFERPVLISYGDGPTLAGANCDRTYYGEKIGYWEGICADIGALREPSVNAAEQREMAIEYMTDHLARLPIVVAARVGRLWGVFQPLTMLREWQLEGKPLWASYLGYALYVPLAGLAVYGVVVLRRRRAVLYPLLVPPVVVTVIAAAFYGLLRNRVPAEVCIVVLAGVALDTMLSSPPRSA